MLRDVATGFAIAAALALGCTSTPLPTRGLPDGTIREGTLGDSTLVRDTKAAAIDAVGLFGCRALTQLSPYVLEMPTGPPGSRVWRELGVAEGCGETYPLRIRFEESVLGARWTIEDGVPIP